MNNEDYVIKRDGKKEIISFDKIFKRIKNLGNDELNINYASLRYSQVRAPDNLPLFKPPYSHITAIDMNNGEHLWQLPIGETPDRVLNHPEIMSLDIPTTGSGRNAQMGVTKSILMYTGNASDGTPM